MDMDELKRDEEKLSSSEAVIHERVSGLSDRKKLRGYEPHPRDDKTYEMFGLNNSFDELSVGADSKGRITLAASSRRSFHDSTINSEKKRLRGSRRRIKYEHFGEFYTNAQSEKDGAFAFRTNKNLPESRILTEFENNAEKYISPEQRKAVPFLDMNNDIRQLSALRGAAGTGNDGFEQRRSLEGIINRKRIMRDRFIRRLRIARRKTYVSGEEYDEELTRRNSFSGADESDGDNDDNKDDNNADEKDDNKNR